MDIEFYVAFILASAVLVVIPGPNVSLIVANSVAHGARRALLTVAGTSSAQAIQLAVVATGMTTLAHLLATWFEWLRWAGVAYLVWLGIQRWRAEPAVAAAAAVSTKRLYWQGFLVAATNPKTLVFFAAFLPQFIDSGRAPAPQLVLLSATFLVLATVLDGSYAVLGGRMRGFLRDRRRARIRNRISGSLLIGAGLGLALARRT
ncbi:MAG: LysE family translocator [Alphaproteobacteria bacterium]